MSFTRERGENSSCKQAFTALMGGGIYADFTFRNFLDNFKKIVE